MNKIRKVFGEQIELMKNDLEQGRPAERQRIQRTGTAAESFDSLEVAEEGEEKRAPFISPSKIKAYLMGSSDCLELGFSFAFLMLCLVLKDVIDNSQKITQRPIPHQFLEKSEEYVLDFSFNEELKEETFNDTVLVLSVYYIPIFIQLVLGFFFGQPSDFHSTLCSYSVAAGLVFVGTDIIKSYVGYFRPIFYTVCQPDNEYLGCTNADADIDKLNDLRKSFLSGHAAYAFCGLTLFSMYLQRIFGLSSVKVFTFSPMPIKSNSDENEPDVNGTSYQMVMKYTTKYPARYRMGSLLCLLPLVLAFYIALSRVVDNEHHPADIVAGSTFGASVAIFFHKLWFPCYPSMNSSASMRQ